MRLVIDMQALQSSGSRQRGIGRYALSLVQALLRQGEGHEIILAFNGLFSATIPTLRALFTPPLLEQQVRVWDAPGPVDSANPANAWRRQAAELVREAFLFTLKPDLVLVLSLFEGLDDDAVVSIKQLSPSIPHAVIVYDLIPYEYPNLYLQDARVAAWYARQFTYLQRADLLLTISSACSREVLAHLPTHATRCVTISSAVEPHFQPRYYRLADVRQLKQRYGLTQAFIMYTGGVDPRKNTQALIEAFAALPHHVRADHQLAIVCRLSDARRLALTQVAQQLGLLPEQVVFTHFVPDDDLLALYNLCKVFVFPSLHEGFGLPVLEAMACGRAVLASNTSSLPEVVGRDDALFDPHDVAAITAKLLRVLTDDAFRQALEQHALQQAAQFSWDKTAASALTACEALARPMDAQWLTQRSETLLTQALLALKPAPRHALAWMKLAEKIAYSLVAQSTN